MNQYPVNPVEIEELNEPDFNLRHFFYTYVLRYWIIYVLCILIGLGIAYYYNLVATPIYSANTTVLITSSKSGDPTDILHFESFSADRNIQNQIVMLKSRNLVAKTIKALDFDVSYFLKGKLKERELYKETPIEIKNESLKYIAYSTPVKINILNDYKYQLSFDAPDHFKHTYNFDEPVSTALGTFTVQKNSNYTLFKNSGKVESTFVIRFNTLQNLIEQYSNNLTITAPSKVNSSSLSIFLTDNVPTRAIDFLNKYVEIWIQNNLDEKNEMAHNALLFIDEQLAIISKELTIAEGNYEEFRSSRGIFDLATEGKEVFEQATGYDQSIAQTNLQLNLLTSLEEYVEQGKSLETLYPATLGIPDNQLSKLVSELSELYAYRDKISTSATQDNPTLIQTNVVIETTKSTLLETIKTVRNVLLEQRTNTYGLLAETETKIRALPGTERQAINIQREVDLKKGLYTFLSQKRAETAIAVASTPADNKIIDKANGSFVPIKPGKSQVYAIGFLMGLLVPSAFVYFRNFVDDKVRDLNYLEKNTSIPLLGIIGINETGRDLVVKAHPRAQITEAFRSIRTNLQYFLADQKNTNTILITSSISSEGKSFCALNLGGILALSGKKTVLLGFDLRKPKLPEHFSLKNEFGISNYLIGTASLESIIQKTDFENLSFILSGPKPPNPAELLTGEKVDQLFEFLKGKYDYLIIDSPPIGLISDALLLDKYADATIYIVRQNVTRKQQLRGINKLYREDKIKNLSVIYNAVKNDSSLTAYGYAYGYGYGYYEK